MVGVPRSKGCRICVQRRVRCDEARPTCNNCRKGGRPCPGYTQDLKFQDEGARIRKKFGNVASSSVQLGGDDGPAAVSSDLTRSVNTSVEGNHAGGNPGGITDDGDEQHQAWDILGLDIRQTDRRAFVGLLEGKSEKYRGITSQLQQDQLYPAAPVPGYKGLPFDPTKHDTTGSSTRFTFANYWVDNEQSPNFFRSLNSESSTQNQLVTLFQQSIAPDTTTIPQQMKNHTRWLKFLPPLTGTNKLLDSAVRAVTLIHVGRLNNHEPLIQESRPYYGAALHLLNTTLQDFRKGMANETLCATILLSFYEMFASDNNDSWVRHAGGVSALMRARGPTRHRNGFDREIFLAYRYTLIIEAFQQDIPCFLNDPDWRKLSEDIHQDLKRTGIAQDREEIFDLGEEYFSTMARLPELCADAMKLRQYRDDPSSPRPPFTRPQVIDRLNHGRSQFKDTFSRFEGAFRRRGHAPTINLNMHDPVVGINYGYINTYISSTFTGYWTVLTRLNLVLSGLQQDQPDMTAHYATENRENGLNICRSVAYMLTSSFLGPFFVIFGLRICLLIFNDTSKPECEWVLRKLWTIGEQHMGIAKHIPGYRTGMGVEDMITEFKANKQHIAQAPPTVQTEFDRTVITGVEGGLGKGNVETSISDLLDLSMQELNMDTGQFEVLDSGEADLSGFTTGGGSMLENGYLGVPIRDMLDADARERAGHNPYMIAGVDVNARGSRWANMSHEEIRDVDIQQG